MYRLGVNVNVHFFVFAYRKCITRGTQVKYLSIYKLQHDLGIYNVSILKNNHGCVFLCTLNKWKILLDIVLSILAGQPGYRKLIPSDILNLYRCF